MAMRESMRNGDGVTQNSVTPEPIDLNMVCVIMWAMSPRKLSFIEIGPVEASCNYGNYGELYILQRPVQHIQA